mgnify:CR=1 FL=1
MRISTFFYTLKQGFRNIFRNKLFSLASIATIRYSSRKLSHASCAEIKSIFATSGRFAIKSPTLLPITVKL